MPADLQRHIRYPEDFFGIQARKYATYHMLDPQVFYNREDLWAIPRRAIEGRDREIEPYYTIMRLPGEPKEEFVLLTLFNPSRRDNMIALAGGALGPAALRHADRVQLPQAEARLRPAPDRRADRPGPRHLPAALAVEPARVHGHPGLAAGDPASTSR